MIYALTNGVIYVCFSLIIGGGIVALIPQNNRVEITLKRRTLMWIAVLIPVAALFPVAALSVDIDTYQENGLVSSFFYVLNEIETGRAWVALLFFTIVYISILAIVRNKYAAFLPSLLAALGMILTQSVVGHSANMASYPGALAHSFHLAAVCVWAGILLVVSWFSKDEENWYAFIEWFTFFAIGCIVLLSFTGMFMSFSLTESVVSSWTLPYGQALLIKHLLFLILLVFAFINGFLIRQKVKNNPHFSPRPWWKAESAIVLAIFSITGFMTEQEPPHNLEQTLNREGASVLFRTFSSVGVNQDLLLRPNLIGLFFIGLSMVFLLLTLFLFVKQETVGGVLFMSGITIVSLYMGLMNSLESMQEAAITPAFLVFGHAIINCGISL